MSKRQSCSTADRWLNSPVAGTKGMGGQLTATMIGMSGMAARFETSSLRQSQTRAIVTSASNLDSKRPAILENCDSIHPRSISSRVLS
jgi:hypothetical protein